MIDYTKLTPRFRPTSIDFLNSLTKYPSIPTYHPHDPARKGKLVTVPLVFPTDEIVYGREKVDGTGTRILLLDKGDYIIGSREEIFYCKGDRYVNHTMGIVATLKPIAERLALLEPCGAVCLYFEVYGRIPGLPHGREYAGTEGVLGARLFDVAFYPDNLIHEALGWKAEALSGWRERGGQPFLDEELLRLYAGQNRLDLAPLVHEGPASEVPTEIERLPSWLAERVAKTACPLDGGAGGRPEGMVLRTGNRHHIVKIRYADYGGKPK